MKALVTAAACGIVLLQTAFAAPDFAARAAATCTRQGAFGYRFGEQAAPGARVVSDWAGRRISVALGSE